MKTTDRNQEEIRQIFIAMLEEVSKQEAIDERELAVLAKKFAEYTKGKKVVLENKPSNIDFSSSFSLSGL